MNKNLKMIMAAMFALVAANACNGMHHHILNTFQKADLNKAFIKGNQEMQDKVSTEIAQIIDLKIKKQVNEKLLGWATRKISAIKPVSPTKKIALNNKESYSKSKFKFVFENSSFNKSQCLFNKTSQI